MITREQAIAAAQAHHLFAPTAHVDAYLGTASDSTAAGAISNRAVWIVHLSGISVPISIPAGVKLPAPPQDLTNGYIYIDAVSGAWILSRFEN
jgi:hypothetical protein